MFLLPTKRNLLLPKSRHRKSESSPFAKSAVNKLELVLIEPRHNACILFAVAMCQMTWNVNLSSLDRPAMFILSRLASSLLARVLILKRDIIANIFYSSCLKLLVLIRIHLYSIKQLLLSSELEQVFRCMENRRVGGGTNAVMANEQVRSSYAASLKGQGDSTTNDDASGESKRKTLEQDADCPICFDSLASGSLTFCRGTCGTNFHEDCIRRWLGQHRTDPTCPNCRQPWQSTDGCSR